MEKDVKPEILLLTTEFPPHFKGGEGVQSEELARGLVRAGAKVQAISFTAEKSEKKLIRDGVTVHFRSPPQTQGVHDEDELLAHINHFIQTITREVEHMVQTGIFEPDLIHCQGRRLYPMGDELRTRLGIPLIGSVHFLHEPTDRWFGVTPHPADVRREAEYVNGLDAVLAVSHALAGIIKETHSLSEHKIHVVHNGVDTALFRKDALPGPVKDKLRRTMAKPEEKLILFAGRLSRVKGLEALIGSAAEVVKVNPNVRYLVAGEASSRAASRKIKDLLATHPQLDGRMTFLGRVSRKQLSLLYQVADLVLVTSLYESFPYSVTEAMASARPVVATDTGGIPEIITNDETGLLVPVRSERSGLRQVDIEELIRSQLDLLESSQRAARLASAGYHHVSTHLTLERMVKKTLAMYRAALAAAENQERV